MRIGKFDIELLSEGRFKFFEDGHINRCSNDRESSSGQEVIGALDSMLTGINPILIKTGPHNILLDCGLGWGLDSSSNNKNVSNILTNLEIFGIHRKDITHVILSHLHYDHIAGCSFINQQSKTEITFPNASYYLHQQEWDFALQQVQQQNQLTGIDYRLDEFYRLMADEQVVLLKEEKTKIVEGITAILTGGHTPGHQIVAIKSNGEGAYYLGDILPSSEQLNHYAMSKLDVDPVQAKKMKMQLLRQACQSQAILLFYHSKYGQTGRLIRNKNNQYILTEVAE